MARPDPDEVLQQLDPEQREVATSLGQPVVVMAGAGTGKTRAITHRIAYGALTGALDPRATLAVTFTTRAAGELRGRLAELGVLGVQARTFHSAALRQAQYFWPTAYGAPLPEVTEARYGLVAEAAGALRLATDTALVRDLASEISWCKVSNVLPEAYPSLARVAGRTVGSLQPEQVARVLSGYEALLQERRRIDFDDILLCTVALLSEHDDVADRVRRTYRHLVVDEYQDVSPVQQRLVDLWLGEQNHDVCVVGDPAQTIHSFAGARPQFLRDFPRRHPGARRIELVRDYRSTPEVVAAANEVLRRSAEQHVTLVAQQPPGPAVLLQGAASEAAEAEEVAAWLAELGSSGVAWNQMAVLYRVSAQSPALELALAERKIPYQVRNAESYYDRPEVRQAMAALAAAARTEGELEGVPRVRAVVAALGWSSDAPPAGGRVRERWESQNALVESATEIAARLGPSTTLAQVVAELERRASLEQPPSASGVVLSTLHSAKGLEWEAVALFGAHEGSIPFVLATSAEQLAEERRLLYVGITRARRHLRISWARSRNGGGGDRSASRFLDSLVGEQGGSARTPQRRRQAQKKALARVCRVCQGGLTSPAERVLGRHEDCPAPYNEPLLAALKQWRTRVASAARLPAYCVFTDATLTAIAEAEPLTRDALAQVPGVGPAKLSKYAADVLALVEADPDPD
ncbi:MAG: ATP-dependent DNA helicase UvrD2 [Actinomycetia bacterium]|nr:ATP-dependent DNA helicase UvrD2 [Actinomycetes bacterium]